MAFSVLKFGTDAFACSGNGEVRDLQPPPAVEVQTIARADCSEKGEGTQIGWSGNSNQICSSRGGWLAKHVNGPW